MATRKKGNKRGTKTIKNTLKAMVCSPAVVGNTSIQGSCFTDNVLLYLQKMYNKHHPLDKINTTNIQTLWDTLRIKLSKCNTEDCWLSEIDDMSIRSKIDAFMFAPDMPNSWKQNPGQWLSNHDIFKVLTQYENKYPKFKAFQPTPIDFDVKPNGIYGGCVSDELCNFDIENYIKLNKTKFGIVYNLDKHNQGGSHWVSLYIELDDKFCFFMDSAGMSPHPEITKFIKRIKTQASELYPPIKLIQYKNSPLEHQYGTTECGMYSLFFIITMLSNTREDKEFKTLKHKIGFFKNKRIPDKYIFNYRKQYFNI